MTRTNTRPAAIAPAILKPLTPPKAPDAAGDEIRPITVTQPYLPPLEEFMPFLELFLR